MRAIIVGVAILLALILYIITKDMVCTSDTLSVVVDPACEVLP